MSPPAWGAAQYRALAGLGADVLFELSRAGAVRRVEGWQGFAGMPPHHARGLGWLRCCHVADRARLGRDWRRSRREGRALDCTCRLRRADGGWRWARVRAVPADPADPSRWLGRIEDVHHAHEAARRMAWRAVRDPLTGLFNRGLLHERLQAVLDSAARERHAVLYLDLDGFKPINDAFGHRCGDEVLRAVAARLRAVAGRGVLLARVGGDEFVAVLDTGGQVARAVRRSERFIEALRPPFEVQGVAARVGVSIGVAQLDASCRHADEALARADRALYRAKSWRRGGYVVDEAHAPAANA